ncbi:MAG: hypothetical protein HC925_06230 [Coleofasciculaceae cyanobacterium SM2_3_26]|nr:hypothetical protein [Coleofasciculaceae cyanobacterium SM2_3_26]
MLWVIVATWQRCYWSGGDTKDASEAIALMQAEAHHRRDAKTLETLAWALSREGRWQEAQTAIALALDQGVRDARIFYRAAAIAEALGNSVAADTYYRQAWEVDPTFDRKTYQRLRLLP